MTTTRPVIYVDARAVLKVDIGFEWAPGFAISQRRLNVSRLHEGFLARFPDHQVLEISSASSSSLGQRLSATVLSGVDGSTVEGIFQGSKVFAAPGALVGPFPGLYALRGRQAKGVFRSHLQDTATRVGATVEQLSLDHFDFRGTQFGLSPEGAFYNWVYLKAVMATGNSGIERALTDGRFTAFTDIFFNPRAAYQSQAVAAAVYVALKTRFASEMPSFEHDFTLFSHVVYEDPAVLSFVSIHTKPQVERDNNQTAGLASGLAQAALF